MSEDWTLSPTGTSVATLTKVPLARRNALRDGPGDHATFRAAHDSIPALREIEVGGPPPQALGATDWLRLVVWNVERLRHLDALAERITTARPSSKTCPPIAIRPPTRGCADLWPSNHVPSASRRNKAGRDRVSRDSTALP